MTINKNKCKRILPCSIYNYTPDKHEDMQKDMSDKWMIHFKGNRKGWMKEYAA
jgi:hypothetical protein